MAFVLKKQWFVSSKAEDIRNSYAFVQELGAGAYGKVFKAINRVSHQEHAVKQIQKARVKDFVSFQNEMEILRHLDHPNVVKILETYESPHYCYLVLEYCAGGDLFARVSRQQQLSEYEAAFIMRKLFSAVAYCHNRGVCHKDLKPENILFLEDDPGSELTLIDFGLAQVVDEDELMHSVNGSPYYIAPEILEEAYGKEVDCWSLGVVLYILLSGVPPFNGRTHEQILAAVFNAHFDFRPSAFRFVSNAAKDLISRLIVKDPKLRMKASDALEHPWVKQLAPLPREPLPSYVFEGLQGFIKAQKLRRATLLFIASKLSERDVENLRVVFQSLDRNQDGTLNRSELYEGMQQIGQDLDAGSFGELWELMDTNQNGLIDYTEFLAGCLQNMRIVNTGYLRTAFEYFDEDNSGFISSDEVKNIFRDIEVNALSLESEIDRVIGEIDRNGDGLIDYKEFLDMMTNRMN